MEPYSDLPPATGSETQIVNTTVTDAAQPTHPPYDEMITAAILAMKEKDGSSRQAIAKFIESEYKNLPLSHASLLTQHLRKMKIAGKLVMNKHSYMLPGSGVGQSQAAVVVEASSVGTKRKPGRPPKIQANGGGVDGVSGGGVGSVNGGLGVTAPFDPIEAVPNVVPMGEVDGARSVMEVAAPFDPIGAVPNVVPMGEVDGGTVVKRRPGRPPKMQGVAVEAEPIAVAEPGVGEKVKVGRKPGRPPKANNGSEPVSAGRRPGRPPKVNNEIIAAGEGGSLLGKRKRGPPFKKTGMVSALMGMGIGLKRKPGRPPTKKRPTGSVMGPRPRGRPRKGSVLKPRGRPRKNVGGGIGSAIIVPVEGMGDTGRPSKLAVRRKPRKLSGKPLGRPKKGASLLAIQSSSQESISFQELKDRTTHFQSRVKHAVEVLRPYLSNELAPVAVGVLQEIEALALMDLCAPAAGGAIRGETEAVTGTNGTPMSDQAGPVCDPVAPLSAQGSEPVNQI
ncbi:hypothetical protein ACET3Z_014728 [Daucus carota]